MKQPSHYIILGLSLAILIFSWLLYDQSVDSAIKEHDLQQSITFHKHSADSLSNLVQPLKDSLEISFATIRSLNAQREDANRETVKWRDKYEFEKGKRIGILSDASYDSALNSLYPQ